MHTWPLPELRSGERVGIQLPGQKTWTPGTCDKKVALRSYDVYIGGGTYRWNSREIRRSSQEPAMVKAELKSSEMTDMPKEQPVTDDDELPQMPVEQPNLTVEPLQPTSPSIWHSKHARKANVRLHDYVC